jgi:hypothetical protein
MHYFGNISTEDLRKSLSRSELDVIFLEEMRNQCEKAGKKEGYSCYFNQYKKEHNYYWALKNEIEKRELLDGH